MIHHFTEVLALGDAPVAKYRRYHGTKLPQCIFTHPIQELVGSVWLWGYRIYEFDPRLKLVTTQRNTSAQLTMQVDAGTEEGGEYRPGQLQD
jgi:hypothetical protein